MLKMRREQMSAFAASALARADARLAEYARRRFPEEFSGKTDDELMEFVARVRGKADEHGVASEADVSTALDLTVMYGPDFYTDEWASDVFEVEEWDGQRRMEVIRQRVRREVPEF